MYIPWKSPVKINVFRPLQSRDSAIKNAKRGVMKNNEISKFSDNSLLNLWYLSYLFMASVTGTLINNDNIKGINSWYIP